MHIRALRRRKCRTELLERERRTDGASRTDSTHSPTEPKLRLSPPRCSRPCNAARYFGVSTKGRVTSGTSHPLRSTLHHVMGDGSSGTLEKVVDDERGGGGASLGEAKERPEVPRGGKASYVEAGDA